MKTYTVYFDKGVMKAFESPEKKTVHLAALRLCALPIAEESKELVEWLIFSEAKGVMFTSRDRATWQPDQTKFYEIEAEMRKETIKVSKFSRQDLVAIPTEYLIPVEPIEYQKVLVLVENN